MTWTDHRVEKLKDLHAKGLSAAAIARKLGGGVTRNAVIGKRHRLGLSDPKQKRVAGKSLRGSGRGRC